MKRVVIAAAIIAAIMVYSASAVVIIKNRNSELIAVTEEIREYNKIGDSEKAAAAADVLQNKWYAFEREMSVFVRDDKLSTLSASVAKIPSYITAANDELDAELESIHRQLNIIYRSELPAWYNIL
ncbi:MAG: DUF4363 family protein [Oscillospiraceae bacterium]|nr:DUF4363 family protein [Oscillospiraceae bacterium]